MKISPRAAEMFLAHVEWLCRPEGKGAKAIEKGRNALRDQLTADDRRFISLTCIQMDMIANPES